MAKQTLFSRTEAVNDQKAIGFQSG